MTLLFLQKRRPRPQSVPGSQTRSKLRRFTHLYQVNIEHDSGGRPWRRAPETPAVVTRPVEARPSVFVSSAAPRCRGDEMPFGCLPFTGAARNVLMTSAA